MIRLLASLLVALRLSAKLIREQVAERIILCCCLQVMAIATLERCYNNPAVFAGVVKIRKGEAVKMMMGVSNIEKVKAIMHHFASQVSPVPWRVMSVSRECVLGGWGVEGHVCLREGFVWLRGIHICLTGSHACLIGSHKSCLHQRKSFMPHRK